MLKDKGQLSFDFLLGIIIFLFTLMFVIEFIPGLFISTSGEGSLDSVAYRTANLLVEDPGWWGNSTHNGTNWEIHTGNISRIGLAEDEFPNIRRTYTPNKLNRSKILQLIELNETMITNNLGLYDIISGTQVEYGYNITCELVNRSVIPEGYIITLGKTPSISQDIFKVSRLVLLETVDSANLNAEDLTCVNTPNDKATINITGPKSEDVIIQITGFNTTGPKPRYKDAKLITTVTKPLDDPPPPSDYILYKKTNTSDFFMISGLPLELNTTDTLRFIFNSDLFPCNETYKLELNFNQLNFTVEGPPFIEYENCATSRYNIATLIVKVWK